MLRTRMVPIWHSLLLMTAMWSAFQPADTLTWWLDMAPAILIYGGVVAARRAFPLTPMTAWLLASLLVTMAIGAHYGFAAVPWFEWLRLETGGQRNGFDRLAHFLQGFVPAALIREVLVRSRIGASGSWLNAMVVAFTLALSALYELIEWSAVLVLGQRADSFVASQGDPWDAQTDMALALLGALVMTTVGSRIQDRQIAALRRSGCSGNSMPQQR